jgi:TatD DNase family protein
MHCFTETREVAADALDLGFHISFSGIVSFKNAEALRDVARFVPSDRLLGNRCPLPCPDAFPGKTNQPAYVRHVAQAVADARGESLASVAEATSRNFFRLFKDASPS